MLLVWKFQARFFIAFILNTCFLTAWLFLWTHVNIAGSQATIVLSQICLNMAFTALLKSAKSILENQKGVWSIEGLLQRLLVQNSLLFYVTGPRKFLPLIKVINMAEVLFHKGLESKTASIIPLSIFTFLMCLWRLKKYSEVPINPTQVGLFWGYPGRGEGAISTGSPTLSNVAENVCR